MFNIYQVPFPNPKLLYYFSKLIFIIILWESIVFFILQMRNQRLSEDKWLALKWWIWDQNSVLLFASLCAQPLSRVRLPVTLWTVARQAPLSVGFPRQEYWSGLPFPPPVSPISSSGEIDSGSLNLGGERHCGPVSWFIVVKSQVKDLGFYPIYKVLC